MGGGQQGHFQQASRGLSQIRHFNLPPRGWRNQCTLILKSPACLRLEKHCLGEITPSPHPDKTERCAQTHTCAYMHAQIHKTHTRHNPQDGQRVGNTSYRGQVLVWPAVSRGHYHEPVPLRKIPFVCSMCEATLSLFHGTSLQYYVTVVRIQQCSPQKILFLCQTTDSSSFLYVSNFSDMLTCETNYNYS